MANFLYYTPFDQILTTVFAYGLFAFGVILLVAVPVFWLRGRWRFAAISGLIGGMVLVVSIGPGSYQSARFRQVIKGLPPGQVLEKTPDLTGRTVALLDDIVLQQGIRFCPMLLTQSGAERVYVLDPEIASQLPETASTDWSHPVDLSGAVIGEIVQEMSETPEGAASDHDCILVPVSAPQQSIDYLMINDIILRDPVWQKAMIQAILPHDYLAHLKVFMAPVQDEQHFVLTRDAAELMDVSFSTNWSGFPYPAGRVSYSWPLHRSRDLHKAIRQSLCRKTAGSCRLQP